jgi:tetratricopeptide (TPR) repeat protein
MPNFLWSGKARSGREEAEEVSAETPAEARKILEARGWTELRQHTTEIADFIHRQQSLISRTRSRLTPKEKLQYRQGTAPGLWGNWAKAIGNSAVTYLLLAGVLGWAIYDRQMPGDRFWIAISAAVLAYGVLLYPVLRWWFRQTKRLFVKLHTARTWYRWDEVLRCLDKLVEAKHKTNIGINDYSMARYRALALAGLGRLDEALTGFSAAAEKAETPPWLYHTALAGINTIARQYDKALENYRTAFEAATDKSIICIDLAMCLVWRFNRPQEARQLLSQAEKMQFPENAIPHLALLRGAIAYREKNFSEMDRYVREALADFEKHPRAKRYLYERSILNCKSYLAVSSAALGRKSEARKYFAQTEKYIDLKDQTDLISEYKDWINRSL